MSNIKTLNGLVFTLYNNLIMSALKQNLHIDGLE